MSQVYCHQHIFTLNAFLKTEVRIAESNERDVLNGVILTYKNMAQHLSSFTAGGVKTAMRYFEDEIKQKLGFTLFLAFVTIKFGGKEISRLLLDDSVKWVTK